MAYSTGPLLIVMVDPRAGFSTGLAGVPSLAEGSTDELSGLLAAAGARMTPLFGREEHELRAEIAALPVEIAAAAPDLSVFYRIDVPVDRMKELAERIRAMSFVHAAYIQPPAEPPIVMTPTPNPLPPPDSTPDFTGNQLYLGPAPDGIDALFAWTLEGGQGDSVEIIDIETAWRFTHEDLIENQGGLVGGTVIDDLRRRNHGTAVIGVFGGDDNGLGVKGIAPNANTRAISHADLDVGPAIMKAANLLSPGDIILVEAHAPGPRFNFTIQKDPLGNDTQNGFVAMQYFPQVFQAITFATVVRGVIVVEAAGNGSEDLDDPLYSLPQPQQGIPAQTPFDRTQVDNGSIMVGAGAPPPGTHGRDNGPDRSRLPFSNFGACIDAQGWGAEVTTCGFGDIQGGGPDDEDRSYTDQFNGTSSAAPIVAGALACIQGVLKAAGKPLLTPITARQMLRTFGSAQQDAPSFPATQRIGNRPDLFLMLASV